MKTRFNITLISLVFLLSCGSDEQVDPELSNENQIVSFEIGEQIGNAQINGLDRTINIEVLPDTDLSDLSCTIVVSENAIISPDPSLSNFDFYNTVTFTVTAENGTTSVWNVIVLIKPTLEFVDVGGHSLEIASIGSGAQTIILEAGLGGKINGWTRNVIYTRLSKNYQVIAYNRAGYGNSDIGPTPRSLTQITDELDYLIESKSDNEKVVLVGFSIGGAIARFYAIRFVDKVDALLLIDPTHEGYQWSQETEDYLVANMKEQGGLDEARNIIEMLYEFRDFGYIPDIPVTILTAILSGNVDLKIELHQSLGRGISDSNFRHIEVSSEHEIHRNKPELIIEEINKLIEKL